MKVLLLTLFVAFVASAPIEDGQNAVQVVVNGLSEGQPLEIGDVVDIKLKKHVGGQVAASSDLLHPYTAVGLTEAAAAIQHEPVQVVDVTENEVSPVQVVDHELIQTLPAIIENDIIPEPVVLPSPVIPEVVPEPVVLPSPVAPEVAPEPVVLPESIVPEVVLPEPVIPEVVLPEPVAPEVVPSPVVLPEPATPEVPEVPEVLPVPQPQLPNGEIYNDGNVQVTVNTPEDPDLWATLQSWVGMVVNYFNNGAQQTTQQII